MTYYVRKADIIDLVGSWEVLPGKSWLTPKARILEELLDLKEPFPGYIEHIIVAALLSRRIDAGGKLWYGGNTRTLLDRILKLRVQAPVSNGETSNRI